MLSKQYAAHTFDLKVFRLKNFPFSIFVLPGQASYLQILPVIR